MTHNEANFLRDYLANSDVPCPGCGYNLRALTGAQCPECGDEIKLQIGLAEPRLAANIAGLIGLAAGAGLNGLLLVFVVIVTVFERHSMGGFDSFIVINLGGLCIEGAALFLWLRFWRRIRRLPPSRRWPLVAASWLLTLTDVVVFSIFVK
jgi:hypothetical protein